jgi:cell division inhibitor SulA
MENVNIDLTNTITPLILDTQEVVTTSSIDTHIELIKIIKRYENYPGWTLLIAPEKLPDRQFLKSCDLNLDKVLTIRKKCCRSAFELAKQAISFDNCAVLVIWDNTISGVELTIIQQLAQKNGTAFYLLNGQRSGYGNGLTTRMVS